MTGYIYKFTNKVDNIVYIGQTTHLFNRLNEHYHSLDGSDFHLALKGNGIRKFTIDVLEVIESDDESFIKSELNRLERYYIEYYDSFHNGYNQTLGGSGRDKGTPKKEKISTEEARRRKIEGCRKGGKTRGKSTKCVLVYDDGRAPEIIECKTRKKMKKALNKRYVGVKGWSEHEISSLFAGKKDSLRCVFGGFSVVVMNN